MRAKTNYAGRPAELEVFTGDEGQSVVVFRLNIEEVPREGEGEEGTAYTADEYRLTVPSRLNLAESVRSKFEEWKNFAISKDFEIEAEAIRKERDLLLAKSDWTQMSDVTTELKEQWRMYRQKLRDLPEQPGFPYDVVFPTQPGKESK